MAEETKKTPPRRSSSRKDFVAKLVADPSAPPAVYLLSGYLGESGLEDHSRLYLRPDLATWVDIPEESLLHTEKVSHGDNVLGAVFVWVRNDARLSNGTSWPAAR